MSNPAPNRKVAVSYAWKQEKEGENHGSVVQFCEGLTSCNIQVLRDTEHLKFGQGISDFMAKIGSSDFLCIFLSDDYLRSPNCMYELLVAWQRSRHNAEEFRSRVKVWLMPGVSPIHDMDIRDSWSDYWHREFKNREPLLDRIREGLSTMTIDQIRRIEEIAKNVDSILAFLADTLLPDALEKFEEWVKSEFPELHGPSEDEFARVFEETALSIEEVLSGNEAVRTFMMARAPELFDPASGGRKLRGAVRAGDFDVAASLGRVKQALGHADFKSRAELDALEKVIGGLVVMAIDPRWVFEQRRIGRVGTIEYPGTGSDISLGKDVRANFLHVVTQALADGHARLHRIFGDSAEGDDARHIHPPPLEDGALLDVDKVTQMKVYLIRVIQGDDITLDVDNPSAVDRRFNQVRALVSYALREEKLPYFSDSVGFRAFSHFIKENLEMSDLLLMMPSGEGSEEDLLEDYVYVLKHLHHIFQAIDARRKQLP